eukprot:TRINITY_DN76_c0_g1_i1.p1 TRINITY_DN76_c0_g1~~TRINITY_DN76_c0_g1_i1.p1  ORF type:complete len:541 (-),score=70.88 TRINITY_DN76_c0_g1_i1:717-2339(-)
MGKNENQTAFYRFIIHLVRQLQVESFNLLELQYRKKQLYIFFNFSLQIQVFQCLLLFYRSFLDFKMMNLYKFVVLTVIFGMVQQVHTASLRNRERPSIQKPSTLLSKYYGFSKYIPPSRQFAVTCEEARQNCVNRCSEENMEFQCSQFYGVKSTCTCVSQPTPPQSRETARCRIARKNCEGTCGGEPNFQCSDNGFLFSQSCSCVEISDYETEHVDPNPEFFEPKHEEISPDTEESEIDVSDSDDNDNETQVISNHVFESVELYGVVPEAESVDLDQLDEPYFDDNNDTDSSEIIDECELAFNDCQIKCGFAVPEFECIKERLVTSTSCACVSSEYFDNEDSQPPAEHVENVDDVVPSPVDEVVTSPQSEDQSVPQEVEKEDSDVKSKKPLDAKCQIAYNDCAKKCGDLEFKFDCQNKGAAFAKSCVCSKDSDDDEVQAVVNGSPETHEQGVDVDSDDHSENGSDDGEDKCAFARKDCQQKCGNMEPKFDCKILGTTFAKSCSCSSGSKYSNSVAQTFTGSIDDFNQGSLLDRFGWLQRP